MNYLDTVKKSATASGSDAAPAASESGTAS
jgi:hypothetical protein